MLVRFSEDPEIVRDLVQLEEELEDDVVGVNADPLTCVRRTVWGMPHADGAGIDGRPCQDDNRHRVRFRSSRPHSGV